MKKVFIILLVVMIISGILSGFQYKERKEFIDSQPIVFESPVEVDVPTIAGSAPAAADVPVFDGACN